jgi:hypothetical protein
MVAFNSKDFGAFVGNPEVEQDGVWFPITSRGEEGPMFRLAFANVNNPVYAAVFEKEYRQVRKLVAANGGTLPKKLSDPIMIKVLAKAIIKDWKNVIDEAGKAIPFNTDNVIALLTAFPRVLEIIIQFSKEPEYFSDSAIVNDETDLGNSKKSSRGVSNTEQTPNT